MANTEALSAKHLTAAPAPGNGIHYGVAPRR